MTRAKDISKIITDADFSGTLDVTGTVTAGGLTVDGLTTASKANDSKQLKLERTGSSVGSSFLGSDISSALHIFDSGSNPVATFYQNQDVAFYEDTGTTPKLFWDSSAECLNVGTTTSEGNFNVNISTPSDYPFRLTNTSSTGYGLLVTAGDGSSALAKFRDYAGNDRVYISGAGNVGIGTNSPNEKLTVNNGAISFLGDISTPSIGAGLFRPANNTLAVVTGSTERMRITNGGKVGIGDSSPDGLLTIKGNSDSSSQPSIRLKDGTDTREAFVTNQSGDLIMGTSNSSDDVVDSSINILTSNILFKTDNAERMRVDSSGNLLVGKTSSSGATAGAELRPNGDNIFTRNAGQTLILRRNNNDGDIVQFNKDGTTVGSIGVNSVYTYIGTPSVNTLIKFDNGRIIPANSSGNSNDNSIDLGVSSSRFQDIFATNGTIQTSDRNEKQDIEELSDAEKRVAVVAKGLMRKYRWKSAVAEKGDNARTHFGIIAQDLQDAFTAEGLDAGDYAMFTSNTWWEKEISVDAVEADEENGIEAQDAYTYIDTKEEATEGYTEKTRLGVRYNQLLAFIISAI